MGSECSVSDGSRTDPAKRRGSLISRLNRSSHTTRPEPRTTRAVAAAIAHCRGCESLATRSQAALPDGRHPDLLLRDRGRDRRARLEQTGRRRRAGRRRRRDDTARRRQRLWRQPPPQQRPPRRRRRAPRQGGRAAPQRRERRRRPRQRQAAAVDHVAVRPQVPPCDRARGRRHVGRRARRRRGRVPVLPRGVCVCWFPSCSSSLSHAYNPIVWETPPRTDRPAGVPID